MAADGDGAAGDGAAGDGAGLQPARATVKSATIQRGRALGMSVGCARGRPPSSRRQEGAWTAEWISLRRAALPTIRAMDDRRVGALIRAVRVRHGWRQDDLASAAGVSSSAISRAECGHLDELSLVALRAIAGALDIRLEFAPWWRGGDLDRIVNAGHTAMHEAVARRFASLPGWTTEAEVTFSIYGERGSIDLLGFHAGRRALIVVELKTEIPDPPGVVAQVDRYARLAGRVATDRGWDVAPGLVSRWVVVGESSMTRRQVARHQAMMRNAFPADGRAIDGWLADPRRPISCLSFISPDHEPESGPPRSEGGAPRPAGGAPRPAGGAQPPRGFAAVRRVRRARTARPGSSLRRSSRPTQVGELSAGGRYRSAEAAASVRKGPHGLDRTVNIPELPGGEGKGRSEPIRGPIQTDRLG